MKTRASEFQLTSRKEAERLFDLFSDIMNAGDRVVMVSFDKATVIVTTEGTE